MKTSERLFRDRNIAATLAEVDAVYLPILYRLEEEFMQANRSLGVASFPVRGVRVKDTAA